MTTLSFRSCTVAAVEVRDGEGLTFLARDRALHELVGDE